ncbi:MAG: ImmA/IrrE family metallo-endopeptidase [Rhizobacter sp.]|nr:ImmA/IrrE family metallo-endopeptidase [Ferruginibacter sp.]
MPNINYELIILARESMGITQRELAELLKEDQGKFSKIEHGLMEFPEEKSELLSTVLGYPDSFFRQSWKPIRVEGHYRKKVSLAVKVLKEYKAVMTLAEKHVSTLLDAVELPILNCPSWDVETHGSPELCAQYVRDFWRLPKGRILNITTLLEDNGIIPIELDLKEMDGFATFSKEGIPLIFINKNRPGDRDLFNKAHELAHFVMHFGKSISQERDIDKEANEFASEFLLPLKDIEHDLVKLSIPKLADLKRYWRVSMSAILKKAKDHGYLSPNQSEYLWKQMSKLGYRTKEPVITPREKATLLQEMFATYLQEFGYTKNELARLLEFSEDKLDEWYFDIQQNRLKIIKTFN